MKKIVYIDMDWVLADFEDAIERLDFKTKIKYMNSYWNVDWIFKDLKPIKGAIESVKRLDKYFNIYILSSAPWGNSPARTHKIERVKKYFWESKDSILYRKLILSSHKNLNKGDYLIDDRKENWAKEFEWDFIQFWTDRFSNRESVLSYMSKKEWIDV